MSNITSLSTALLTEHLRHTPVSLIDDVINSINTIGYKAVDWVEQGLLGTPLSNLGFPDLAAIGNADQGTTEDIEEKARHEIENGVHQFETLLEATIDKNFDKMEVFALRSIIAIPDDLKDWIRLRHYEGLNFVFSPDGPTLESITLQRRKFQETQRLQRLLQAEVARNTTLIKQLRSLLISPSPNKTSQIVSRTEPSENRDMDVDMKEEAHSKYPAFAFLTQKGDLTNSSAATPLSTTTAFALSQLPAMKALLADLRPAMKTLESFDSQSQSALMAASSSPLVGAPEQTFRQQRLAYIESQTRRLQINVRGLELSDQGRVRDGEWQEEGRRMLTGEVEALERVVGLVSGVGVREVVEEIYENA